MKTLLTANLVLLSLSLAARGDIIVGAPPDSGFGNCFPFGCDYSTEYQQVYTSSLFPGPYQITGLEFFNTQDNTGSVLNSGSVAISLSTTPADWNTLSSTYSNNIGANNTLVFSGTIGGPWSFPGTLTFNFSTPFLYDPAAGNLLMDVQTSLSGGNGVFFDTNGLNNFGFNGNNFMGRVYNYFGGSTGNVDNGYGLETDFVGAPLPEPSSVELLLSVLSAALFFANRRRRVRLN